MSSWSVSISASTDGASWSISMAAAVSRCRRAISLRTWSVMRRKSNLNQPSPRIVRNAFTRPLHGRRYQGLLHSVLGSGEVVKTANHHAEHLRRKIAQQMLGSDVQHSVRHGSSSVL